jgi:methylphosphotriester-DNA--protein-cysteine methyltransferase
MSARLFEIKDWERLAEQADFNAARLAVLCSTSPRQLQRIFQEQFQSTPRRSIRQFQCRLAMKFLANGHSNKETAFELHFAGGSLLSRIQKIFGTPPQVFASNFARRSPELASEKMSLSDSR